MRNIEAMSTCRARPGAHIAAAFQDAKAAGYEYLWFNGKLYIVATQERAG